MNVSTSPMITSLFDPDSSAVAENWMQTFDGTQLFYRSWNAELFSGKAVILFHGGHEHSGRFQDLVDRLALDDFAVFAWDARGHGRSNGEPGSAHHFHDFVKDADCFLQHVSKNYGIRFDDMLLMGHSVGSVVISTWLQDYARKVRGVILGSPAFHVKLYAPFALPALRVMQFFLPDTFVNSYVKPGFLTHDLEEAEARRQDSLISPKISVAVLTSLFDAANRVIRNAGSITAPLFIFSAGSDWVVKRPAQEKFFRNLSSRRKALLLYPGFFHEVFHEQDRHLAISQAREYILSLYREGDADGGIKSRATEMDSACIAVKPQPGNALTRSIRNLGYSFGGVFLKTAGRLSNGIQLGWQVGFDAGRSLDYVYRNRPGGWSVFGRLMDKVYLNSPGWRGIRQRRVNLQHALDTCINELHDRQERVHILDVAAGPGRLVVETAAARNDSSLSFTCRDFSEGEVEAARALATKLEVANVNCEIADAFNPASFEDLAERPDVVIVSGLYELFSDNVPVLRSLKAIINCLNDDGYLIYTNQPHHPQLELIAGTLINRDGAPWIMRPRSQTEMQELLADSGFEIGDMMLDENGIFVVGVARKANRAGK